eukprot:TRINITY_DN68828_c0_g1_i1.p1 TRINITY_DN68828_c0_g1~~TRINITY_DN68828_c0_g1_i1.p1  ORF type:complete len:486 (-),score=68.84 TRINITY_DN68828_c0_g1_i1:167-1558(-)
MAQQSSLSSWYFSWVSCCVSRESAGLTNPKTVFSLPARDGDVWRAEDTQLGINTHKDKTLDSCEGYGEWKIRILAGFCIGWIAIVPNPVALQRVVYLCSLACFAGLLQKYLPFGRDCKQKIVINEKTHTTSTSTLFLQGFPGPEQALPKLRPSTEEAAEMRARGDDPYLGQRLNYLAGTSVPFEPLLEELTPTQRQQFAEFERTFPKVLAACDSLDRNKFYQEPDRFTLLLFLQADSYNNTKATQRLLAAILWRQRTGFDDFVDNPDVDAWNLYWKLRPRRWLGWQTCGHVVSFEPLGAFFGSDNGCRAMPISKWLMCYAFDLSLQQVAFRQGSIRSKRPAHRVDYVGDLTDLRVGNALRLMGFLRQLTTEVERFWPESAGNIALINASSAAWIAVNAAKKFLDPSIAERVTVHKGVPRDYFKEHFDFDAIPVSFGGNLKYELPRVPLMAEVFQELGMDGPLE